VVFGVDILHLVVKGDAAWKTLCRPNTNHELFLREGKMAKKVLLIVLGAFLLTVPAIALGSYSSFSYPNVPALNESATNGVFHVYVERGQKWEDAGKLSFDRYFRPKTLDIARHVVGQSPVKIRLVKEGGGTAQIDSVLLNSSPALSASGMDADLKKLAKDDFDVVDASGKGVELEFHGTGAEAVLSLSARIEESVISKTPFQYPLENTYKEMGPDSKFYHYRMEKGNNGTERKIFQEYSVTGSGHPSGYTYGWARNDEKNLYVRIDFTPDDTMDGDKDYAKVYIRTEKGIREFKVSVPETKWGNASFIYTDKVAYQHKVYDFAIPLKEIGITNANKPAELTLAFAAYGTASPFPPCPSFDFCECYKVTGTDLTDPAGSWTKDWRICFDFDDKCGGLFYPVPDGVKMYFSLFFGLIPQMTGVNPVRDGASLKFHGEDLNVITGDLFCFGNLGGFCSGVPTMPNGHRITIWGHEKQCPIGG
jgi:hypothetical protein